ncbi:carbonic anhydrase 4b [Pholidichthys leucotaenia]
MAEGSGRTTDVVAGAGGTPDMAAGTSRTPDVAAGTGRTPDMAADADRTPDVVTGAEECLTDVPELWGTVSQDCNGRSQSPVNIVTRKALLDGGLTKFHLTGYQETFDGQLINTGHSVQINLPASISIEGGNLNEAYKAVQLHLHWGTEGGRGSEHTIDGEHFPMEMHIVHMKETYTSLSEAVNDQEGLAVLGFVFEESESANTKYDRLINALVNIPMPTNSTPLTGVSLDMLIPSQSNMTKYFRYYGSLTTPGCDEAVVWTLFENTIPLSKNQLTAFNQLLFADGKKMVDNYRPVQPLNGRQVYYSKGHVVLVNSLFLCMSVLLSIASSV